MCEPTSALSKLFKARHARSQVRFLNTSVPQDVDARLAAIARAERSHQLRPTKSAPLLRSILWQHEVRTVRCRLSCCCLLLARTLDR